MKTLIHLFTQYIVIVILLTVSACKGQTTSSEVLVQQVLTQIVKHDFHPLNEDRAMTIDRTFNKPGIADLSNGDWRIRLLAVRDLVRAGIRSDNEIIAGLSNSDEHVRQVCAMALGILKSQAAIDGLEQIVREDKNTIVRSQAVIALGQIESRGSLELLHESLINDPSRDVKHQCELAIDQIEKEMGTTEKQLSALLS